MPVTFLENLETRTVNNPYAVALPTVHIMEPYSCDQSIEHPVLMRMPYDRAQQLSVMTQALPHLIRLRLGGICCDLEPLHIANVIYEACGVECAGVDLFTRNKGCCSVWVRSEDEASRIRSSMHHCVWMGPPSVGYAVRARNALSVEFLEEEVHKQVKLRAERFPRHLVTVERYVV